LKPTVDGMVGQKVFNASTDGISHGNYADGLFKSLRDLMGPKAPSKHEVRTMADGLSREALDQIVRQIGVAYSNGNAGRGADPWRQAQRMILQARSRL
jgi:hypothetical protein